MKSHNYYVYILTNWSKAVLYVGVTNNLSRRLFEHSDAWVNKEKTFCARYKVLFLVYWEEFQYILEAIAREKELKKWSRAKKNALICQLNPQWDFLNIEFEGW